MYNKTKFFKFMFKNYKKLIIIVFIPIICLLISFWFLFTPQKSYLAKAEVGDVGITGYAWSGNFGWISFSSNSPVAYGVKLDVNGFLKGYAWSSNFGWVYFGPDDPTVAIISTAPEAPLNWAKMDPSSGKITGWAKVLSMSSNGWIKMSDDNVPAWNGKGVKVDIASGDFSGWAWGNNGGVGTDWISFNNSSPAYGVKTAVLLPNVSSSLIATVTSCHLIRLDWDDNSDVESGFELQSSPDGSTGWTNTTGCLTGINQNNCSIVTVANHIYYFRVRALGVNIINSDWYPASGGVMAATTYCAPVFNPSPPSCAKRVDISWTVEGSGWDHFDIWRSVNNNVSWVKIEDNILLTNYTDLNINNGSAYYYKVVAQNDNYSSIIGPLQR